jgi:hypothetical protein
MHQLTLPLEQLEITDNHFVEIRDRVRRVRGEVKLSRDREVKPCRQTDGSHNGLRERISLTPPCQSFCRLLRRRLTTRQLSFHS